MRSLFLVWLLIGSPSVDGQVGGLPEAPVRDVRPTEQTGTGSIQGRVTAADTGAPFRRATVYLVGIQPSRPAVFTDDEGRYAFTRLPAGTYTIQANPGLHRGGYHAVGHGGLPLTRSFDIRGKPIHLADGQRLPNVDIALPRAGVIAGRVTDASGEPMSRVQVQLLLMRAGATPTATNSTSTNDLGEFRLFDLLPGDYLVMAMPPNNTGGPEIEGEAMGFGPSYSPGVAAMADATRIRIGGGSQVTADIRLAETRVYTVAGTVVTSSGEPARGGSISLIARESPVNAMFNTAVSGTGTFRVRNLPPGTYELLARYQAPRPAGAPSSAPASTQEFARNEIDLAADMEHVLIPLSTGAVVRGEVVFDEQLPSVPRVSITPTSLDTRNLIGVPAVEVSGSQFTLGGVFGPLLLRANASGGAHAWTLKAVTLRGNDITDEPRLFTAADSGHLQVMFTSKAPAIEGSVTGPDGQPAGDATVVLFGHDPKTWKPRSSFSRTSGLLPKDGTFTMRGLREGRYYAAAIPLDVMINAGEPTAEFLEALSAAATVVILNEGETRRLDLRVLKFEKQ